MCTVSSRGFQFGLPEAVPVVVCCHHQSFGNSKIRAVGLAITKTHCPASLLPCPPPFSDLCRGSRQALGQGLLLRKRRSTHGAKICGMRCLAHRRCLARGQQIGVPSLGNMNI